MTIRLRTALMAASSLCAWASATHAQTIDPSFQSSDQSAVPSYAASLPNGGAPIGSVQRVTGLGQIFGFGSSSTDMRSAVPVLPGYGDRWSNGNVNYLELLAPIVGATARAGATQPLATPAPTSFAQAGTTSLTALPQVTQFQNAYGRFAPNDIAVMWSGINDWSGHNVTAANYQSVAASNVSNQTSMVSQLIGLGARSVVVLGQVPFGTFQYFTISLGGSTSDANAINQGAVLVNQGLEANLAALHTQSGANIHLVNTNLFLSQIRANPTAYGFTAAGVASGVNCFSLLGYTQASCPANASFAVQNQYLSWDGIHYSYRFHSELAQVIANQLIAPYTIAPQAVIGGSTSSAFASSLLLRLDAYRNQDVPAGEESMPVARPFSLFVEGDYNNADRSSQQGGPGFGSDPGSVTVGGEYQVNSNLMVGAAFNYASPSVRLTNLGEAGNTRISLNAYQIGAFATLARPNWYLDGAIGYGFDSYKTNRNGLVSQLTATPNGNTAFAATKAAYLFDIAGFKAGPMASLTYSHVWINRYTEGGDPLLTQSVGSQNSDSLVGALGVQVRRPVTVFGHTVSPFVNLAAEREFLSGSWSLVTAQTYALDLPSTTAIRGYGGGTYGRVAAGASVDFGGGVSAMVNGSSTFARAGGNDFLLNGGVKFSF